MKCSHLDQLALISCRLRLLLFIPLLRLACWFALDVACAQSCYLSGQALWSVPWHSWVPDRYWKTASSLKMYIFSNFWLKNYIAVLTKFIYNKKHGWIFYAVFVQTLGVDLFLGGKAENVHPGNGQLFGYLDTPVLVSNYVTVANDAMHKHSLCCCAVSICPSVHLSVTFVYFIEMSKRIFKICWLSGSHTILVSSYQIVMAIFWWGQP